MPITQIINPVLILGGLGLALGAALAYASKVFHVEQDERLPVILDLLPGANCGGCGYAGCATLAQKILDGEAKPNACPVGGPETAIKISEALGIDSGELDRFVAHVQCRGGENAKRKYEYEGLSDCSAALKVVGGPLECSFGCLGYGSCVKACEYDALHIENGVAVVHAKNCVACGKCVQTCPRHLISIVSFKQDVFVSCNSHQKGGDLRKVCNIGCIGCSLCQKKCPNDAITIEDNLAVINYDKCINCGECVDVCPRKLIVNASESVSKAVKS